MPRPVSKHPSTQRLAPSKRISPLGIIAVAGAVVVAGITVWLVSSAAGQPTAFEAESGTLAAPAQSVVDASASSGHGVKFGPAVATPTPTPAAGYTPPGMRVLPSPLYGVTFDNDSGASTTQLNNQAASLTALPHMPTARIVFDEGQAPSDYQAAVNALQPKAYLMGELLDSESMKVSTVAQYQARASQYVNAFGSQIDLWEVGNEVNGNWTGNYTDVAAKITAATNVVTAASKRSALTLWYNDQCGDGPSELDPVAFSQQYLPAATRNAQHYVLISYYQTQCNDIQPTVATLTTHFQQLHALFPNALLGFGEVGLPDAATSDTQAKAQSIINYYYKLKINLPYYIGGYFYWYYAEDCVPYTSKPIWQTLHDAMVVQGTL